MHRTRAYLAALLFLVLSFGAAPAAAVTSADLNAHRNAASEARRKAAEATALAAKLKTETEALDDRVAALQAETDALDPKIAAAELRTQKLVAEVQRLRSDIASKTANIESTRAQYELEQQLLSDRVRATYRQGEWFYIDMLLGSTDVRDLITRTELVGRVIRSNNDVAAQLASTKSQLEQAKAELDHNLQTVSIKRREAETVESDLKRLQGIRQSKTDEQEAVLNQKSDLMAESKKNAARLLAIAKAEEEESARIAAMLSKHKGSGVYNGVMSWPVPGFFNVTSSFGWRVHPIFKTKRLHAGVDVGKNGSQPILGAAIVAAGNGTVIWAGSRGGYGNVVMIDHGNGVVSVYAHQQSGGIKVGVGQSVKKGQRIGTVGSTGYSTGPHLHFEVRVNGEPVNPMQYLQ